jgi:hypothetical protein
MGVPSSDKKGGSGPLSAHAMGATLAGTLEIAFFHPFDTIAKRLMSNQKNLSMSNANEIIFKHHANSPLSQKVAYLYPGSTYAVLYKVLQRVYKFAGQPILRESFHKGGVTDAMKPVFGSKSKMMTESISGSLIGIGEIVLLPLDRLKVLSQTNDAALANRSLVSVIRSEGMGLYAGAGVTAMRNAPGSFCLFGGTAFTKDVIFGLDDYSKATFTQNMIASTVGSVMSIACTNPMDVVKTRIQNKNFGEKHSAGKICREILRDEGISAFMKGVTPKVTASAPKLIFAYTMTEFFAKRLRGQ